MGHGLMAFLIWQYGGVGGWGLPYQTIQGEHSPSAFCSSVPTDMSDDGVFAKGVKIQLFINVRDFLVHFAMSNKIFCQHSIPI